MKNKKKKKNFRYQLMRATSIFVIVPLILFFILFQGIKEIIVEQYSESAKQSVQATADNIDYALRDVENMSNSILMNHELLRLLKKGKTQQFISILNSYFNSSFNIEGIYTITSFDYNYVGANLKSGIESIRTKELDKTSGEIVWFSTKKQDVQILSGNVKKNYFSMGRKIIDVSSLNELGYMSIMLDDSVIQENYKNIKEDNSEVLVCDLNGNIVSSTNGNYITISKWNTYMNTIYKDTSSGYIDFNKDGKDYMAIYSSLNHNNWRIVKTIPKSILYKEINTIQFFTLIGIILLLFIMLILSFLYSKSITQPITRMILQMKEIEGGNLKAKVDTNVNNELDDLGTSFNHMVTKIQHLMDEVVAVERNKNELELEVLHAQINPHFLYNTLNTIRWMAKIKNEHSISDAIVALVKLLRVSISLDKNKITLKEEIDYIENYILIQKLRFNQSFEINYNIMEEHKNLYLPKLILQPIVENSLIYGNEDEENNTYLKIDIFTQNADGDVEIIVKDNGPGIDQKTIESIFKYEKNINKFSKVGLNNVNQRIKMYFGDKYGIDIESNIGNGTKVIILVPNNIDEYLKITSKDSNEN